MCVYVCGRLCLRLQWQFVLALTRAAQDGVTVVRLDNCNPRAARLLFAALYDSPLELGTERVAVIWSLLELAQVRSPLPTTPATPVPCLFFIGPTLNSA